VRTILVRPAYEDELGAVGTVTYCPEGSPYQAPDIPLLGFRLDLTPPRC
jgi:hypothetical protein